MSLHCKQPISKSIRVDDENDVLIAYGTRISGDLLRTLGEPTPEGMWFRIVKIDGYGTATVETKRDVG